MPNYKAPRRDMQFVLYELLDIENHYSTLRGNGEVDRETIEMILEGGAKFSENELAPLYRSGDEEGCLFEGGEVKTPAGFKAAYETFVADGWPSMASPEAHGGQGLPISLGTVFSEMLGSANWPGPCTLA